MLASYMKKDGNTLYFKGDGELIYYVPEKYFDLTNAYINGEYVETMGVFAYSYFDKSGKSNGIRHFKCPTMIKCKPTKIEKVNHFQLDKTQEESEYRLLHFENGSELISELSVPQSIENVSGFLNLVIRGHLPSYIPYNEIQDYLILNAEMNGFKYKVSWQILGLVISELYRDKDDLSKPFRLGARKSMLDYKAINITSVPKYTSTYTAIISENPDEAIASSMLNKGTGSSPLEKVMMN